MTIRDLLRQIERSIIRPFAKFVGAPFDHSVETRLAQLESGWPQRFDAIEKRLTHLENGWRQHVPGLLNAASSVAAFGFELASLRRELEASTTATAERTNELRRELAAARSQTPE